MVQVQDLAKSILDKWGRKVFGISTSYDYVVNRAGSDDDEGDFESAAAGQDQYRNLRRKLERIR